MSLYLLGIVVAFFQQCLPMVVLFEGVGKYVVVV